MSQLQLLGYEAVTTDMSASRSAVSANQRELLLGIVDWIKQESGPNYLCHRGPGQLEIICCLPYILSCASQNGELPKDALDRRKPILIIATEEDCLSCLESGLNAENDNKQATLLTRLGFMTDSQARGRPSYLTFAIKNAFDSTWFQVVPKVHADIVLCSHAFCSCLPDDSFSVVFLLGKHKLSLTEELRIKSKFEQHSKIIQFVDSSLGGPTKAKHTTKYLESFRASSEDSISTESSSTSVKLMGRIAIDGVSKFKFYKLRRVHPYPQQPEKCVSSDKQLLMSLENLNERMKTVDKADKVLEEEHDFNSSGQPLGDIQVAGAVGQTDNEPDFQNDSFSEQQLPHNHTDDNVGSEITVIEPETGTKETSSSHEIQFDRGIHGEQDRTECADMSGVLEELPKSSSTTICKERASGNETMSTHIDGRKTDSENSVNFSSGRKKVSSTDLQSGLGSEHMAMATQLEDTSAKITEREAEHSGTQEQEECADKDGLQSGCNNSTMSNAINLVDNRLSEGLTESVNKNQYDSSPQNSWWSGPESNVSLKEDQESGSCDQVTTKITVVGTNEMSLWHEMQSEFISNGHYDRTESANNTSIPEELSECSKTTVSEKYVPVYERMSFNDANKASNDYSTKNVSQKMSSNECNLDHLMSPEIELVPDNSGLVTSELPNASMSTEQWVEHSGEEKLEECAEKDDHDDIRSDSRGNCDAIPEDKVYEEIDDDPHVPETQNSAQTNASKENNYSQHHSLLLRPEPDTATLEPMLEEPMLEPILEPKLEPMLEPKLEQYCTLERDFQSGPEENSTALLKQYSGSETEVKGLLEEKSVYEEFSQSELKQHRGSGPKIATVVEERMGQDQK